MMNIVPGLEWWALAPLLLLALAGALRWDVLRLWWRDLLKPAAAAERAEPLASEWPTHAPSRPPTHLHPVEASHQPQPHKPAFHRSGRRG